MQHVERGDPLLIYTTERGLKVELAYKDETLWATQKQMAEMFGVTVPNVSTLGEFDEYASRHDGIRQRPMRHQARTVDPKRIDQPRR